MSSWKSIFKREGRNRPPSPQRVAAGVAVSVTALVLSTMASHALIVELKDVAPDRIERQRAEAIGQIPLPNTPNIGRLAERLKEKKLAAGNAVLIRVFKAESELELWMQKGDRFELFAVYPICHWSGTLGPKINEGDKQSPEGVYTVSSKQLHLIGRHPRSLNLGFPNALDRQFSRTGSYILIHGGCGSVGCFAMTNPVIEEIFSLTQAAIKNGQDSVQVHSFPFRMSEERLQAHALNEWYDFWRNLKDVHDSFDRTKRPPRVTVCEGRYWVEDTLKNGEVASHGPLAVCGASLAAEDSPNSATGSATTINPETWSPRAASWSHPLPPLTMASADWSGLPVRSVLPNPHPPRKLPTVDASSSGSRKPPSASARSARSSGVAKLAAAAPPLRASSTIIARVPIFCNETRPSCRKWVDLQTGIATRKVAATKVGRLVVEKRPNARVIIQR